MPKAVVEAAVKLCGAFAVDSPIHVNCNRTCPFGGRVLAGRCVEVRGSTMRLSCVRLLALCFVVAAGVPAPVRAADISVILDQARMVKLPDRVATIVIGNPVIADAAVQSGGWMVITGKGYGTTNIVALDRTGAILMERTVEVQGPQNVVVVYRGVERHTFSCTPECSRQLALGDGNASFEVTAAQIAARNALAAGAMSTR